MKNPVKELRERTGLTAKSFAVLYGINLQGLRKAEAGHADTLPAAVIMALIAAGQDPGDLERHYQHWRRSMAEAELAGIGGQA